MSQENVERARQGLDAINRRDRAAWLALCDPELEDMPPRDWPESNPIQGADAVFEFLAVEAQDAWEGDRPYEYVELIDAGNDMVVMVEQAQNRDHEVALAKGVPPSLLAAGTWQGL